MDAVIERVDAEDRARAWLAGLEGADDVVIDDRLTTQADDGWVFRFDTRAGLAGADDERLVGVASLFVDGGGTVHQLVTGRPVEEQLSELRLGGVALEARARVLLAHQAVTEELARGTGDDEDRDRALAIIESKLRLEYQDTVPEVAVSRCPLTDEVVWYPIDGEGLDGLWWRADDPVRPEADMPATVLGITGALHLTLEPAAQAFTALPGPAVPVVVPAVLEVDGVVAVLSTIPVGPDIGYVVAYFAEGPSGPAGLTEWGRRPTSPAPSVDGDLRPWIESGKLLWVAPFDPDLTLRRGTEDCPYLGLEGTTEPQIIS